MQRGCERQRRRGRESNKKKKVCTKRRPLRLWIQMMARRHSEGRERFETGERILESGPAVPRSARPISPPFREGRTKKKAETPSVLRIGPPCACLACFMHRRSLCITPLLAFFLPPRSFYVAVQQPNCQFPVGRCSSISYHRNRSHWLTHANTITV